jgi:propionyl-CoA carboxylase alpha chain
MFTKILIANRGEIACRIIKTARRMGIRTVAVFSDADRDALHVQMADEAVHIGPAPAAQSYLVIDNILAACKATGAEAVHPGYGFLSERAAFAEALDAAGIVFIGPNAQAIAAMGDKIESKKRAAAAKVSTVPGYMGVIADSKQARRIADEIGYPVMIKASAGGGGKGMRIAHSANEIAEGFERARSEAAASFGDDRLFIEKFITDPRHIEIQLLGDSHGNVIYLNERECSIQRRNQKVLEEAPSPLLDAATRKAMGEQAVALAKAVNYDSAGTVEFVAGQDRSFFFLEMNTRLQVEHPVTEMITGIDLVEEMIRVAAGEKLRFTQNDITINGWAVEARIYAEDPTRDFLPSIGRLVTYRPPAEGPDGDATVRNDTGVTEGSEISRHYDPMIAKLVTHAPTRAAAIAAQARALDRFVIAGIRHNIPFLATVMGQDRWQSGALSTRYIQDEFPDGFQVPEPVGEQAVRLAAVALAIDDRRARRRLTTGSSALRPTAGQEERVVLLGSSHFDATLAHSSSDISVVLATADGDRTLAVSSNWRPGDAIWEGTMDDQMLIVQVHPAANHDHLASAGTAAVARVLSPRIAELTTLMPAQRPLANANALLCPMPGLVRSIAVTAGQLVKAGDTLAVVEAMKMENVLRAERDATVKSVRAKEGDILAVDAIIMEFA